MYPDRTLTEDEKLKALDLLNSMRRRIDLMATSTTDSLADLIMLKERLLEHESFAEELQAVIWAAWGEDS